MGEVSVGDVVFAENGEPCTVIAATDTMLGRDCYRVTFSDQTSIVADAEHQWYVEPRWAKPTIVTTDEMVGRVRVGHRATHREHRYRIPLAGALATSAVDLPVAPYTLGAWLGDGHTAAARLTNIDDEVWAAIEDDGYRTSRHGDTGGIGLATRRGAGGSLQATLRREGLIGRKHIPARYLRASASQRTALLQGLMDTDGYISKAGQCEFTSTVAELATSVVELVRSLGMKPTIREGRATIDGRDVGPKWRVQFWATVPVFRMARKLERQRPLRRAQGRYIVAIEPVTSVPVRCIEVDSPSHLFLAGDAMVPTHNSTLGAALAIYALVCLGPAAHVYSCAGDRKQASIVFDEAKRMVRAEPELAEIIRIQRWHLEGPEDGIYRVLSADAELQQGLNPTFVIFDEVHVQPNRDLWDAMVLGMVRPGATIVGITTAGFDKTTLAWDLYERGKRGELYFSWKEPADPGCDWKDPIAWAEANPALGDFLPLEVVRDDATVTPESAFRRFHLNQWTTTHSAWLPHRAWIDATLDRPFDPTEPFATFVDGSWSNDSTGMVAATIKTPHLSVLGHWVPDERLGHIDMVAVEKRVREVLAMPGCRVMAFDPSFLADLFARLEAEYPNRIVSWPTNSLQRMVPACQEFYSAVVEKRVTHDGDKRLADHISNAVLKEDRFGPRIVKEAKGSPRKIDLAVCAVGALAEAQRLGSVPFVVPRFISFDD